MNLTPPSFCRPSEALYPLRLVLLLLLVVVLVEDSMAQSAGVRFQQITVPATAIDGRTQVHPVNLLGGPEKELVLVNGSGQLLIFAFTGSGFSHVQTLPLPLPPDKEQHLYYGFARVLSADVHSLVILSPGSVSVYPVENHLLAHTPQTLFQTKLISQKSPGPTHRYFDMALDFNNDGFDELLLPADNGFTIHRRLESGGYGQIALPRNAFKEESQFTFSRDIPDDPVRPTFFMSSLSQRKGVSDLLFFDANNDGRLDLIYSSTATGDRTRQVERYDVYHQTGNLTFSGSPDQSFAVPYDSQADATFRDINNDGKLDAILVRSNMDIVNPRTVVKFYIASGKGYEIFSKETDRFVTKDPVGLVQVNDFNNDGVPDFAMTFFSYQFGSMEDIVDLAFSNKIQFRLQYFMGRGAEGFSRQPDAEQPITLNTKLENFRGNPPVMITRDMNGDGLMDLVVRPAATELQVYLTRGNYSVSPSPAGSWKIPENATLSFMDMNSDGLCDIIVSDAASKHLSVIFPTR